MSQENYAYLLRCSDGTLYAGWTNDLQKRLQTHQAGRGAKYTSARLPVELAYFETFSTRSQAMQRECQLKRMSRQQKLELIERKKKNGA